MNLRTLKLLAFPIVLLIVAGVTPALFMHFGPDPQFFDDDLFYWLGSFIYLGLALGAIRLTFSALLKQAPEGCEDSSEHDEAAFAAANYARSAELLIMGVALLSLIGDGDTNVRLGFEGMLLFVSLRLGGTLLMLGIVVMAVTHFKMRRV